MANMGIIRVSAELLRASLQLPEDIQILRCWEAPLKEHANYFEFKLMGDKLPLVKEGEEIPVVRLEDLF